MSTDRLTQHFGIAPLRYPPMRGLESLSVSVDLALSMELPARPYWWVDGDTVTIITDARPDVVAKTLRAHTPNGQEQ